MGINNRSLSYRRGNNAGRAPSHSRALQVRRLAASYGEDGSGAGAGDGSYQAGDTAPSRGSSRHTRLRVLSNLEVLFISIFYSPNILSKYPAILCNIVQI